VWDIVAGILELFGSLPGKRVTIAHRYAMKKRVRELQNREKVKNARSRSVAETGPQLPKS
jgi:hypothetical protein